MLAKALIRVLCSPEFARSLGTAARTRVVERFDQRTLTEQLVALYARQLTRRHLAGGAFVTQPGSDRPNEDACP
jgi:hypothetical protein